jgi:hypothetical protein
VIPVSSPREPDSVALILAAATGGASASKNSWRSS